MHLGQQRGRRHHPGAGGGQLDRQRQAVQRPAEVDDGGRRRVDRGRLRAHRPGPGQEQLDGRAALRRGQADDVQHPLVAQPEPAATGHQDGQLGHARPDLGDQVADLLDLLDRDEHQHPRFRRPPGRRGLAGDVQQGAGRHVEPAQQQRRAHPPDGHRRAGAVQVGQRDEDDRTGIQPRRLQRDPGLADPTLPGDGDQTGAADHRAQRGDLPLAADQRGVRKRQDALRLGAVERRVNVDLGGRRRRGRPGGPGAAGRPRSSDPLRGLRAPAHAPTPVPMIRSASLARVVAAAGPLRGLRAPAHAPTPVPMIRSASLARVVAAAGPLRGLRAPAHAPTPVPMIRSASLAHDVWRPVLLVAIEPLPRPLEDYEANVDRTTNE